MDQAFPEMSGLSLQSPVDIYLPDTLFQYIDGAAESFLTYGFDRLASASYMKGEDLALTIDIYRMSTPAAGFGMYRQEAPREGDFVTAGAEGYYEPGVLNFYAGPYYVKIFSFLEQTNERDFLLSTATEVAKRLGESNGSPVELTLFPREGRVPRSETYIAKDFLGHSFLHSAFSVDIKNGESKFRLFLLTPGSTAASQSMVEAYLAFAKERGSKITTKGEIVTFTDPYYASAGPISLLLKGDKVWGTVGPGPDILLRMLGE